MSYFRSGGVGRGLAYLALVVGLTASAGLRAPSPNLIKPGEFNDISLYQVITARVQEGEDYYHAAATEQRAHGYPTTPAVTIREPTEAWMLAALRNETARKAAMLLLTGLTILSVFQALERQGASRLLRVSGILLVTTGTIDRIADPYLHESWASLLICSGLAVWRPGRYGASLGLLLAACLFREIAAPVLLVMAVFAAVERRWSELRAWIGATAGFGALMLVHLWFAHRAALPGDPLSPGWIAFGGWEFILMTAQRNFALYYLRGPLLSAVVALALLGHLQAHDPWGRRVAAVTFAFVGLFWFVGHSYNEYWGVLYASILPLGLLYLPRLLRDSGLITLFSGRGRFLVRNATKEAPEPMSTTEL